ncbi:M56 family metallopeptidase [Paenibacillus sp. MER 99-2]|uniref:M56 family metallopeptidase n=1 Tax=Paenibacillus sp. MER 99-2 TaxID=2939572 RepID=UPI00203DEADB|nr:M56 family metallopeptidase [Paenibacillus sp. MER 99-2]MCM3172366.1 peptidase M56 [Paenibacillus sp. MER 99-2]
MNSFLQILVTLSVAGSIVAACILVLRLAPTHLIPPHWGYRLCKMAVALYLLPISFGMSWFSGFLFTQPSGTFLAQPDSLPSKLETAIMPAWSISSTTAYLLLSIWAMGVLIFLTWQIYCYWKFVKALKHSRMDVHEYSETALLLSRLSKELGIQHHVNLAYSPIVRSPLLVGMIKPTIYLPVEDAVPLDMNLVIHHELIHLKHKDLWVKALALIVSAVHWFNPLVHLIRQDLHTWSEFSCDETVVQNMTHEERKRYGETILNVTVRSQKLPLSVYASLSGGGKQLKRRLTIMFDVKKITKKQWIVTATTVFVIASISVSTATLASSTTPNVTPALTEAGVSEAVTHPRENTTSTEYASRPVSDVAQPATVPAEAGKPSTNDVRAVSDVAEPVTVPADAGKPSTDDVRVVSDVAEPVTVPAEK